MTTQTAQTRDQRIRQQTAIWAMLLAMVPMAVGFTAWILGDAAVRARDLAALRAALENEAPAEPAAGLAGRVVHARGAARTEQITEDADVGVTLTGPLATYRLIETWRSGRNSGWQDTDAVGYTATDARMGAWQIGPEVLQAADTYRTLILLQAGRDYPVPQGWSLREGLPPTHAYQLVDAAERAGDTGDSSGDRRLSYRVLPSGPLSIVAAVDETGARLVPFRTGEAAIALVGIGDAEPAALFAAETAKLDGDRGFILAMAALLSWVGFAFPVIWARWAHWAVGLFVIAPIFAAATVAATAMAANTGSAILAFVAGMAVALATVAPIVRQALRPAGDPARAA